ncbi:hypothetical protein ACDH46_01230 [Aerococcaceae bacterium zg-1292]
MYLEILTVTIDESYWSEALLFYNCVLSYNWLSIMEGWILYSFI